MQTEHQLAQEHVKEQIDRVREMERNMLDAIAHIPGLSEKLQTLSNESALITAKASTGDRDCQLADADQRRNYKSKDKVEGDLRGRVIGFIGWKQELSKIKGGDVWIWMTRPQQLKINELINELTYLSVEYPWLGAGEDRKS